MQIAIEHVRCASTDLWTIAGRILPDEGEVPYALHMRGTMDGMSDSDNRIRFAPDGSFSYQGPFGSANASLRLEVAFLQRSVDPQHPYYTPKRWDSLGIILQRGDEGRVTISIKDNAGIVRIDEGLLNPGMDMNVDGNRGMIGGPLGGRANSAAGGQVSLVSGSAKPLDNPTAISLRTDSGPDLQVIAWPRVDNPSSGNIWGTIAMGRAGSDPRSFFRAIYGPPRRLDNGSRDPKDPNNQRTLCVSSHHLELRPSPDGSTILLRVCSRSGGDVQVSGLGMEPLTVTCDQGDVALPWSCSLGVGNNAGRVEVKLHCLPLLDYGPGSPRPPLGAVIIDVKDPLNRDQWGSLSRTVYVLGAVACDLRGTRLIPVTTTGDAENRLMVGCHESGSLVLGCPSLQISGHDVAPGSLICPAVGMSIEWNHRGFPQHRRVEPAFLTPSKAEAVPQ